MAKTSAITNLKQSESTMAAEFGVTPVSVDIQSK